MNWAIGIALILLAAMLALAIAGYVVDSRRKRRPKMQVKKIVRTEIIGDGAWLVTQSKYPKSARVRDIEPRGA